MPFCKRWAPRPLASGGRAGRDAFRGASGTPFNLRSTLERTSFKQTRKTRTQPKHELEFALARFRARIRDLGSQIAA